ncbi:hypothetical protein ACWKWU_13235 [Chitinophaga lutea]
MGIEALLLIPFSIKLRFFNKEQKLIYIYLITSLVAGIAMYLAAKVYRNNMLVVSVSALLQFVILTFFYLEVIKSPRVRKLLQVMLAMACVVFVLDLSVWEGFLEFNSIFVSFRAFLLIVYGVIYFLQLMRDESLIEQSIFINSLPTFWFNAGIFVHSCCAFLFNLCYNFIQQGGPAEVLESMYKITASLAHFSAIIQAILFYIALLKIKGNRT